MILVVRTPNSETYISLWYENTDISADTGFVRTASNSRKSTRTTTASTYQRFRGAPKQDWLLQVAAPACTTEPLLPTREIQVPLNFSGNVQLTFWNYCSSYWYYSAFKFMLHWTYVQIVHYTLIAILENTFILYYKIRKC